MSFRISITAGALISVHRIAGSTSHLETHARKGMQSQKDEQTSTNWTTIAAEEDQNMQAEAGASSSQAEAGASSSQAEAGASSSQAEAG